MTRSISKVLIALTCVGLLAGCQTPPSSGITQVATINALLSGVYDGHMSLKTLREYGDFGLGTFERLDGELILLDGLFYKALSDGQVVQPDLTERTPFACVTTFVPDRWATLHAGMDQAALEARIDTLVPERNRFCAFTVRGTFNTVRTRSVPAQTRPYPRLVEAVKKQSVFTLKNVSGTLIGFRSPGFVEGINVPGYHMHFLSDDRESGGHVLELELTQGSLAVDTVHDWLDIYLPPDSPAFDSADLAKNLSGDLQAVEKNKPIRPTDK